LPVNCNPFCSCRLRVSAAVSCFDDTARRTPPTRTSSVRRRLSRKLSTSSTSSLFSVDRRAAAGSRSDIGALSCCCRQLISARGRSRTQTGRPQRHTEAAAIVLVACYCPSTRPPAADRPRRRRTSSAMDYRQRRREQDPNAGSSCVYSRQLAKAVVGTSGQQSSTRLASKMRLPICVL